VKPKVYFEADMGVGTGSGRTDSINGRVEAFGQTDKADTRNAAGKASTGEASTGEASAGDTASNPTASKAAVDGSTSAGAASGKPATRFSAVGLTRRTSQHLEATTLYRPTTLLYMSAMTFLLVPVLTLVDIPLARYFASQPFPSELRSTMELTLVFSHGTGVFLILLAFVLMAPRRRWHVPRLATLALGGGALATIAKMFVLRPRPQEINLEHASFETAWLWVFDWDLSQVTMFDSSTRAFPSANVVTATALTIGLWVTLPRGRPLFGLVWFGVLLQRLQSGSHFPSDVCGGVAFGMFWAFVCFHPRWLGTMFDKLVPERKRDSRKRVGQISVATDTGNLNTAVRNEPERDDLTRPSEVPVPNMKREVGAPADDSENGHPVGRSDGERSERAA